MHSFFPESENTTSLYFALQYTSFLQFSLHFIAVKLSALLLSGTYLTVPARARTANRHHAPLKLPLEGDLALHHMYEVCVLAKKATNRVFNK